MYGLIIWTQSTYSKNWQTYKGKGHILKCSGDNFPNNCQNEKKKRVSKDMKDLKTMTNKFTEWTYVEHLTQNIRFKHTQHIYEK